MKLLENSVWRKRLIWPLKTPVTMTLPSRPIRCLMPYHQVSSSDSDAGQQYYYKIILQMNKMIMWLLAILMLVPLNYKYCGKFQSLNPYLHLKCLTMIIFPMLRKRTIVTIQCNTVILLIPVRFLTVLHVATIAYFTRAFTSQILHRKCCI